MSEVGKNPFIPPASLWGLYLGVRPTVGSEELKRNQTRQVSTESDKSSDKGRPWGSWEHWDWGGTISVNLGTKKDFPPTGKSGLNFKGGIQHIRGNIPRSG